MSNLSKARELSVAVFTGFLGAPIAAWIYWQVANMPICDPDYFSGSRDCVVTYSGESRSWFALATSPDAVVLGFIFAGLAYGVLEFLEWLSRRPEPS